MQVEESTHSLPKLPPEKFREAVFMVLFTLISHGQDDEGVMRLLKQELNITRARCREAFDKAQKIFADTAPMIERFEKICESYRWSRIGRIEQAILILSGWELEHESEDLPRKIIFAESSRLAKKFSGPESAGFIGAVLDAYIGQTPLQPDMQLCSHDVDSLSKAIHEGAQLETE